MSTLAMHILVHEKKDLYGVTFLRNQIGNLHLAEVFLGNSVVCSENRSVLSETKTK